LLSMFSQPGIPTRPRRRSDSMRSVSRRLSGPRIRLTSWTRPFPALRMTVPPCGLCSRVKTRLRPRPLSKPTILRLRGLGCQMRRPQARSFGPRARPYGPWRRVIAPRWPPPQALTESWSSFAKRCSTQLSLCCLAMRFALASRWDYAPARGMAGSPYFWDSFETHRREAKG
jgi:hypothetical protein